ncbi:transglycosylase SLT domain-containing protein [Actinoplanes sp. NPDC023936]|uniref:transglycosylase SLT domain-containing protein n=1 Tax=Actinoplanes sp. NPDC023936 TaxID=3154910 RepID=UPI0034075896
MNAVVRTRLLAGFVVLVVAGGCGMAGASEEKAAPAPSVIATTEESPSPEVTEEPVAEESPSPVPSKKPASKKPASKKPVSKKSPSSKTPATPTEDPNNFEPPACAEFEGKEVSKAKAKTALNAAAAKTYWPTSAPKLKVPADLVRAVAWHESGWTSNIVNCDGGFGLMQVMPDTESFINQRFEQSYDSHAYRQNAVIGANYLAWLTKAFGDQYFKGNYSLSASKCKSDSSLCLLNMVIAGYNMGRGSVDEGYANKELVNPEYVGVVRNLMRSCYCDKY